MYEGINSGRLRYSYPSGSGTAAGGYTSLPGILACGKRPTGNRSR